MNSKELRWISAELKSLMNIKPVSRTHREYLLGNIHALTCFLIEMKAASNELAPKIEQWEKDNQ